MRDSPRGPCLDDPSIAIPLRTGFEGSLPCVCELHPRMASGWQTHIVNCDGTHRPLPPPPLPPAPPPSAPPPPPPGSPPYSPCGLAALVDDLNTRFDEGQPSAAFESAGLLVRIFDQRSDPDSPWTNCESVGCAYGDIISASIINRRLPAVYHLRGTTFAGTILRTDGLRIQCSYSRDGYTMRADPCDAPSCASTHDGFWWKCKWGGWQLQQMMEMNVWIPTIDRKQTREGAYNELIVDPHSFHSGADISLPDRIVAFFYHAVQASSEQQQHARNFHRRFEQRYFGDLPQDLCLARRVPMLSYDPGRANAFALA